MVHHSRYVIFQLAEVEVPRNIFEAILAPLRRLAVISPKPAPM